MLKLSNFCSDLERDSSATLLMFVYLSLGAASLCWGQIITTDSRLIEWSHNVTFDLMVWLYTTCRVHHRAVQSMGFSTEFHTRQVQSLTFCEQQINLLTPLQRCHPAVSSLMCYWHYFVPLVFCSPAYLFVELKRDKHDYFLTTCQ